MSDQKCCCGPSCCAPQSADAAPTTEVAGMPAPAAAAPSPAAGVAAPGDGELLRATVRERYGEAARQATAGAATSCGCGPSCCGGDEVWDPITADLYEKSETSTIPAEALLASLGCGNPAALAALKPGERVLDLGSGGGIDVLLSARRVGPAGMAYGLDMTDEMLALAEANKQRSGMTNVQFLRGEIENIPLPNASVDVIISNCVINLSGDKRRVLSEAHRVLAPGGRFAVSDIVLDGPLPPQVQQSVALFTGCVAGALTCDDFVALLRQAGFEDAAVEPTRVYDRADVAALLESAGLDEPGLADQVAGRVMSAFIRARKPMS